MKKKPESFVEVIDRDCCRWPGGAKTTEFCGNDRVPGRSYCAEHMAVCYKPLPKKKDDQE